MASTDTSSTQLFEVLFISTIAPETQVGSIAPMVRKSRIKNAAVHVTGLLIFDGLRFCEQLEGDEEQVNRLMQRIQGDTRHTQVHILHRGPLAKRRFSRFSMGYTLHDDEQTLEQLDKLAGEEAARALMALVPHLDLDN